MVTLLFAVFVTLYALKEGGDATIQNAAGAMQNSFGSPLEDIPADAAEGGPQQGGLGVFRSCSTAHTQPAARSDSDTAELMAKIDHEVQQLSLLIEQRLYGPKAYPEGKDGKGFERIVEVARTGKGYRLRLVAQHFYPRGASGLGREALAQLDPVAKMLRGFERKLVIEGHAASASGEVQREPWDFSARMATALVKYLIQVHRFPADHLAGVARGDSQPLASNSTESGRRLNQRVEIYVELDPADLGAVP